MTKRVERDRFDGQLVSASEVARLAYCEHQIRWDATRGYRTSTAQRAAQRRGDAAHQAFYEESRRLIERSERRGKCFIATLALGKSPHTLALRQFRDAVLRRSAFGRAFIASYYRHSPLICTALETHPRLLRFTRGALTLIADVAAWELRRRMKKLRQHGI